MTKKTTKKLITVLLDFNNKQIESSGATVEEAIEKLKIDEVLKTSGILSLKDYPRARKLMNIINLKSFMANKTYRKIIAKQLAIYVK